MYLNVYQIGTHRVPKYIGTYLDASQVYSPCMYRNAPPVTSSSDVTIADMLVCGYTDSEHSGMPAHRFDFEFKLNSKLLASNHEDSLPTHPGSEGLGTGGRRYKKWAHARVAQ